MPADGNHAQCPECGHGRKVSPYGIGREGRQLVAVQQESEQACEAAEDLCWQLRDCVVREVERHERGQPSKRRGREFHCRL